MASSYSSVYFSSLTHVYPFFLGSILATVVGVRQTSDLVKQFDRTWDLRQNLLVFAAGLLVLVLLTFFVKFTYLFAYLFGFLLASLAAVTMIFAARVLHEKTPEIQEPATSWRRFSATTAPSKAASFRAAWPGGSRRAGASSVDRKSVV